MKFCDKRIARILKSGGKITKPRWGDRQWFDLSDNGNIRHFVVQEDNIYFEYPILSFSEIFGEEWMEVK